MVAVEQCYRMLTVVECQMRKEGLPYTSWVVKMAVVGTGWIEEHVSG